MTRGWRFLGRGRGAIAAALLPVLVSGKGPASRSSAVRDAVPAEPAVARSSAVAGESWVKHLRLSLETTALGSTGRWGSPGATPAAGAASREPLNAPFLVTGRDLYRLNCQACHREDGSGAPPEILPVTSLARATSRPFFREKMKERGLPVDESQLARNAAEAEASIRKRIMSGGEKMPPFPQLDRAETESVVAYVKSLAGVSKPGPPPAPIREPVTRVGELLVKGTCHICHDASATPTTAFESRVGYGTPPPLAFFAEQRTVTQLIRKVREGLVEPSVSASHGRMPVFDYLTPEEITAAYVYLLVEPPGRTPEPAGGAWRRPSPSPVSGSAKR